MVSTKAFVHFIEQSRRLLFTASLRENFTWAADIHIRNKFHFSEVHRIMNVMGLIPEGRHVNCTGPIAFESRAK